MASAAGLCNRELSHAASLLATLDNEAQRRAAGLQLLFAYRCLLIEIAEHHQLPSGGGHYRTASALNQALQAAFGEHVTQAELEVAEDSEWLQRLFAHENPAQHLISLAQRPTGHMRADIIKSSQEADFTMELSKPELAASYRSLKELIDSIRESRQEY